MKSCLKSCLNCKYFKEIPGMTTLANCKWPIPKKMASCLIRYYIDTREPYTNCSAWKAKEVK